MLKYEKIEGCLLTLNYYNIIIYLIMDELTPSSVCGCCKEANIGTLIYLPCDTNIHTFHKDCIENWKKAYIESSGDPDNPNINENKTKLPCPVCRQEFDMTHIDEMC